MKTRTHILSLSLLGATLLMAPSISAQTQTQCAPGGTSGISKSCEGGVVVYRGRHNGLNFAAIQNLQAQKTRRSELEARIQRQDRQIRAQEERLADLEDFGGPHIGSSSRFNAGRRTFFGASSFGGRFFGFNALTGSGNFPTRIEGSLARGQILPVATGGIGSFGSFAPRSPNIGPVGVTAGGNVGISVGR